MTFEPMKFLPDMLTTAPPTEKWDHFTELDAKAWPRRVRHEMRCIPRAGRTPEDYPSIADLPDLEFALILCEMREQSSCWLWAAARE